MNYLEFKDFFSGKHRKKFSIISASTDNYLCIKQKMKTNIAFPMRLKTQTLNTFWKLNLFEKKSKKIENYDDLEKFEELGSLKNQVREL